MYGEETARDINMIGIIRSHERSHRIHEILLTLKARKDVLPRTILFVGLVAWMKLFYHFQLTETYPILGWVTFIAGMILLGISCHLLKEIYCDKIKQYRNMLLAEVKLRDSLWLAYNTWTNVLLFDRFKI